LTLPEPLAQGQRIAAIDGLRGLAVLGILAINVTGFWGPTLASYSPALPNSTPNSAPGMAAEAWYAVAFVLFEGKMRALFSLLFGASMLLFIDAAERRGRNGDAMQARRLGWLALFGYAHYLLLWWGDILFPYALCGLGALFLRRLSPRSLVAIALFLFVASHGLNAIGDLPGIASEQRVLAGLGTPDERLEQAQMMVRIAQSIASDTQILNAGFARAVRLRIATDPWLPFSTVLLTFTETLPLMLIGMALFQSRFFSGEWSRRALARMAWGATLCGLIPTLAVVAWLWPRDFPPRAMFGVLNDAMAMPHLLMALGYAAIFMLAWPRLSATAAGRRLAAAGRCAFTNYLGTTMLMSAIFAGWGLGLGPELSRAWLPVFVVLGWAAMLAWPVWWLRRLGQGPLEALWRRLTWWGVNPSR
jgi:uncharacterized protein